MKKYLISLAGLGVSVFARVALALTVPPPPTGPTPLGAVNNTNDVSALFCGILNWVFWGLIIFAIIMFLVGGYYYVTSAGEADKVSKANKTLLYAAIAVVVALVAEGLPYIVSSFLSSNLTGTSVCS